MEKGGKMIANCGHKILKPKLKSVTAVIVVLSLICLAATVASAENAASFYKGKNLTLVVPYKPGGGYDTWGRLLAPYLGKYTGARVIVKASDLILIDEVHSGRGYQSHYGTRLYFGLGSHDEVDQIEVRWIDGGIDVFQKVDADQLVTLIEGSSEIQFR